MASSITYSSEEELNRFLDSIKQEAEDGRGDLQKNIQDNLNQLRGKQWDSKVPPVFLNNIIESAIEDKIGKLSETRPQIRVQPSVNGLDPVAEVLTKAVSGIWDKRKIEYKAERIALWGCVAGVAFVGTPFNKYLNGGIGDADFVVKDPRACGIDVTVSSPEDSDYGEYTFTQDCISLDKIRYEYPGRGADRKPDARISGLDAKRPDTTATGLLKGAFSRLFRNKEPEHPSAIPKCIIEEFYIQDRRRSIEDIGVIPLVEGITKWEAKGAPFPGGRRILRAGKVILEDYCNPYWDGCPPLDMMGWKLDLESAWGSDDIRGVKRMQQSHNRVLDAYTKNALINSVVRVVMDKNTLDANEKKKLSNEVGQIIEKALGRSFEYMVPPPLPPQIAEWGMQLMQLIRQKIGVAEVPLEKQVPSIVTGPAIEGLQLMLQTPIRTAARRVEEFYQRIGQKLVSRVFQYYLSDRIIHLIGDQNKWVKFEFNRLNITKDAKGQARSKEDMIKAYRDFYFTIEPGSSLAVTKMQRAQAKAMLVQMGMLHPREILIEFYDNPDEKLKEAQEAKSQGMFEGVQNAKGQSGGQPQLAA